MSGFLIAGLCLALSALLVRGLDLWIGSGRAKFRDLSRSGVSVGDEWQPLVDPLTRTRRNDLSLAHYLRVSERGGHRVRESRDRPDPLQIAAWEDDGGATA